MKVGSNEARGKFNRARASRAGLSEHASSDAFAAAMVACQGYAPACSDAGDCLLEGECFERDHFGFAACLIERLADSETRPTVRSGLMRAAQLLRAEIDAEPEEPA